MPVEPPTISPGVAPQRCTCGHPVWQHDDAEGCRCYVAPPAMSVCPCSSFEPAPDE